MQQFTVTGMHCAACSASVEKAVKKVPGVESCAVSPVSYTHLDVYKRQACAITWEQVCQYVLRYCGFSNVNSLFSDITFAS